MTWSCFSALLTYSKTMISARSWSMHTSPYNTIQPQYQRLILSSIPNAFVISYSKFLQKTVEDSAKRSSRLLQKQNMQPQFIDARTISSVGFRVPSAFSLKMDIIVGQGHSTRPKVAGRAFNEKAFWKIGHGCWVYRPDDSSILSSYILCIDCIVISLSLSRISVEL